MVDLNKINVSFQARTGEATSDELLVIQKVSEVIGPGFSTNKILSTIRKAKGNCANTTNFVNEILNNLIDVDQDDSDAELDLTTVDKMHGPYFDKPVEKANQSTDPMDVTDVIPYNAPSNNPIKLDTEDSDLQRALQESLKVSHPNFTTYASSIPEDLEAIIRNPNLSTGLHNAGNTCWFNCVAQVLYHLPKFRSLIYHCVPYNWQCTEPTVITPETVMTRDLLMRMRRLFAEMQFSSVSYIDTSYVLEVVDALTKKTTGLTTVIGEQQDATESLIRIVDWLEQGIKQALEERLNPRFTLNDDRVTEESYIPAGSTTGAPNSDISGISPPSYDMTVQFEGTSKDKSNCDIGESESGPNSPAKVNENGIPIRRTLFGSSTIASKIVSSEPMDVSEGMTSVHSTPAKQEFSAPGPVWSKTGINSLPGDVGPREVTEEETQAVEIFNELMENIFTAKCVVSTVSKDNFYSQREILNSPQFFHLQVSYGDLHDALEASTFDNGRGESSHVQNWFDTLPAAIFMGLSRFGYNNGMPEKIHNRFYFPKTLYMDRYLKKNSKRVLELRERRNTCRRLLAETKALYRGIQEYPSVDKETVNVVGTLKTVISLLRNEKASEVTSPERDFIGPIGSVDVPSSSFVENLGKKFPKLDHSQFSNISQCIETLSQICDTLHASEIDLQQRDLQLTKEIETIYEERSLQNCEYKLHSVIIHSGEANRGHYWSYSRSQFDGEEEKWERLNDKTIENVSWEQVQADAFGNGCHSSPSAYCLMYVRSDSTWLMEPDTLTREQSLSALPDDLKEMVENKAEEFASNLKRFREAREAEKNAATSTEALPANWPESHSREKTNSKWDDENANPTDLTNLMSTEMYLDKQFSMISENNMSMVKHSMQRMFRTIQTSMPKAYYDENAVLYTQLKQMMDTVGFDFLTDILGYNVKDMQLHAENDADKAYETFINHFYDRVAQTNVPSNLPQFIEKYVKRVFKLIKRYLLVKALSISNIALISAKAQFELDRFRINTASYAKAILLSNWSAVFYELVGASAWACKNCYKLIRSPENERNENRITALISARMARYCYNQFIEELEQATDFNVKELFDFELIQVSTVLSLLNACIPFMKALVSDRIMLSSMATFMEENERRILFPEYIREISYSLSALRKWVKSNQSVSSVSRHHNKIVFDALLMLFDVAKKSKAVSVNCDKIEAVKVIDNSLTNDRMLDETLPENIECVNKGFAIETEEIMQLIGKMTRFEATYDELIEKLQTTVFQPM